KPAYLLGLRLFRLYFRNPSSLSGNASFFDARGRLYVGPFAEQVMVNTGKLVNRGMPRRILHEPLNGDIKLQQQSPLAVFAHQALQPEKSTDTGALGNRIDLVQAGARV